MNGTKTNGVRTWMVGAGLLLSALSAAAQNPVKGDYGYLYCHMSDGGE